jgi:hypothetical protein
VTTHTISKEAWVEGYYDIFEPRAKTLIEHPDSLAREFAAETLKEIEVFQAIATDMFFTFCNASDIQIINMILFYLNISRECI